jgi:hypothetical protein
MPEPKHQLHYMEQWGWDVCAGDEYCMHPTCYNCVTCKKLFCVSHGQSHGEILLY